MILICSGYSKFGYFTKTDFLKPLTWSNYYILQYVTVIWICRQVFLGSYIANLGAETGVIML